MDRKMKHLAHRNFHRQKVTLKQLGRSMVAQKYPSKNKSENKNKNKNENESKRKTKTKMKTKMNFRFCFHFVFHFRFCFLFLLFKNFCIFVNFTQSRGAMDDELSLEWPRSAMAFLLTPRGLEVPQMVNSLLLGQAVPQYFILPIFHVVQRCHRWSTLQKCYSTQKYGTQPDSNMQNSMMLFTVFVPFLGKFGPKNQNYHFKLKFGGQPNSNIQNSMMLFTFFVFDWEYAFWANLVQKVKVVSLR